MKNLNTIKKSLIAAAILSLGFSGAAFAIQQPIIPPPKPPKKVQVIPQNSVVVPQNDMVFSIQNDMDLNLTAPTSMNLISNEFHNMGGTQVAVSSLGTTKLVNTIDPNNFAGQDVGAIALNNSEEHMIASNGIIPIGAASKVENNEFQTLGAAYKIEDNQNYDFIIAEPILK